MQFVRQPAPKCSQFFGWQYHISLQSLDAPSNLQSVHSDHNLSSHFLTQSLEKFSNLTHHVSCNLDAFMRVIHDTEFPNSVEATQQLLDRQGSEYESLKESILSAGRHGDRLLEDFRAKDDVGKEFSERNGNVSSTER